MAPLSLSSEVRTFTVTVQPHEVVCCSIYLLIKYRSKGMIHSMYDNCEIYGTNNNRTHWDTHRTSESQSLLFLFPRSYTRRHENFIIEAQFIKNLEDGRTNDGLLQEGCRTRQSKLVDELLLLPEGGGVSHNKWVECLQLLLQRECNGVRDC